MTYWNLAYKADHSTVMELVFRLYKYTKKKLRTCSLLGKKKDPGFTPDLF